MSVRWLAWCGLALAVFAPQRLVLGQSSDQDLVINYVAPSIPHQSEQSNEVRAYFSVLDADRQPVSGLTPDALGVSLFGQPITAFDLSPSQDPMSIILVIDTSGSMSGKPLEQAKDCRQTVYRYVRRQGRSGVVLIQSDRH